MTYYDLVKQISDFILSNNDIDDAYTFLEELDDDVIEHLKIEFLNKLNKFKNV